MCPGEVSAAAADAAFTPGTLLDGRYRIEREIGRGAMGRVFAAHDLKLDREVAVKFLRAGPHGEDELHRFEREARAAGSLDHPNVLVVHDTGASEGGPYIVSELLQGATLRQRMQGKALPVGKAVDYALQLAQGLRAAHAKGVVHRDLKPENLFITHEGRLKILDFGVAKLTERTDRPRESTEDGAIVGTVAYMSPEQVRAHTADARSDVFAFGSILYEMLSGQAAFRHETQIATGAAILNDEPAPLPGKVSRTLERIVSRCLEKDAKDRFQSVADIAVELSGERGRGPRRLRLAFLTGAVLFLAFVLPEAWKRLPRGPVPIGRSSIAVLPFVNLSSDRENEYLSDGIAEELINALANLEGLRVASRTSSFVYKGSKTNPADIGQQLKVATLVEGSIRREGNNLRVVAQLIDASNGFHVWSKTYDREMRNVLSVEEELARSIALALRPSLTDVTRLVRHSTASTEAHDLYLRARYFWNDRSQEGLDKAIALYERAIATDPSYALAHTGLADSYLLLRYSAPVQDPATLLSKARAHAQSALRADETLAEAHTSLASIAEADFDWAMAEREFRRAVELKPDYARAHHWYGALLRDLGRFAEADAEFARALQLEPTSTPLLIVSAEQAYFRRDFDQAIERLNQLLQVAPDQPIVRLLLATIDVQKKRTADAVAAVDRIVSPTDDDNDALGIRGYVHAKAGDRAEALRILKELERRSEQRYVAPANAALILAGLGERDRAFQFLDRSYETRDTTVFSIKVDPLWDDLRPDPRFGKLLKRMNLE